MKIDVRNSSELLIFRDEIELESAFQFVDYKAKSKSNSNNFMGTW